MRRSPDRALRFGRQHRARVEPRGRWRFRGDYSRASCVAEGVNQRVAALVYAIGWLRMRSAAPSRSPETLCGFTLSSGNSPGLAMGCTSDSRSCEAPALAIDAVVPAIGARSGFSGGLKRIHCVPPEPLPATWRQPWPSSSSWLRSLRQITAGALGASDAARHPSPLHRR